MNDLNSGNPQWFCSQSIEFLVFKIWFCFLFQSYILEWCFFNCEYLWNNLLYSQQNADSSVSTFFPRVISYTILNLSWDLKHLQFPQGNSHKNRNIRKKYIKCFILGDIILLVGYISLSLHLLSKWSSISSSSFYNNRTHSMILPFIYVELLYLLLGTLGCPACVWKHDVIKSSFSDHWFLWRPHNSWPGINIQYCWLNTSQYFENLRFIFVYVEFPKWCSECPLVPTSPLNKPEYSITCSISLQWYWKVKSVLWYITKVRLYLDFSFFSFGQCTYKIDNWHFIQHNTKLCYTLKCWSQGPERTKG